MVQFVSYLRRVLCKTRLIFPRINGPMVHPQMEISGDTLNLVCKEDNARTSAINQVHSSDEGDILKEEVKGRENG